MSGNAGAATCGVVAEAVVSADDLVAFDVAEAERNAAVITDVACGCDGAIRDAIEDDALIEKARGEGLVRYLPGVGDGIPEGGEGAPVGFCEGTLAREWGWRVGGSQF